MASFAAINHKPKTIPFDYEGDKAELTYNTAISTEFFVSIPRMMDDEELSDSDQMDRIIQLSTCLHSLLLDWNYTEDGTSKSKKVPCTLANIRRLSLQVLTAMFNRIMEDFSPNATTSAN